MLPVWTWASASVVGTSHIRSNTRKQDAYRCFVKAHVGSYFVSVLSDGAGSAAYGGEGASLACWAIGNAISKHIMRVGDLPTDQDFLEWIDDARDLIFAATKPRNSLPKDFAATLLVVVSDGGMTFAAQIGDGCTVLRDAGTNDWLIPNWPEHGEYASTTYFITDDVGVKCSMKRISTPINSIVMFTDGLERLALNFATYEAHIGFFDAVVAPVARSISDGKDFELSKQLAAFLSSDSVSSRSDDDKTLVVAVLK